MPEWLQKAESIVREAGAIAAREFQHPRILREKPYADVVTQGDELVEAHVTAALEREFPGHGLISEESGGHHPEAESVWILDPIDGSKYYARGVPIYSISLALRRRGDLVLGVVYSPETDQMFSAAAGSGAQLNGEPIRASRAQSLAEAFLCMEIPSRHSEEDVRRRALEKLPRLVDAVLRVRILGVSALGLCYCASGGFDAYASFSYRSQLWDLAAGEVILREAGGTISTRSGPCLLAGPPVLHDQLARLLEEP
jgi:myo-inositol-1(or 4)-monophosphatase